MDRKFDRLKKEMEKQHIKAFSLSKKAGINASDLYPALSGDRPMYPGWKKRIANVLGVPEEDLFKEGDDADEQ